MPTCHSALCARVSGIKYSRSDSFGLVLLEAWANGLPNLAYRAGGIADLVRHEDDGLLAPCGDVAALAAMMLRLIEDSALRRRLGDAGQARTASEFQWSDKLALVRDVCLRLCGGHPIAAPPPQLAEV